MQQSVVGAVLLREPSPDDGNEMREQFDTELTKAIEAGLQVVVHAASKERNRRIPGVIYEANALNALLALASHNPATDGHSPDKLSQILSEAQGTSFPVVRGA